MLEVETEHIQAAGGACHILKKLMTDQRLTHSSHANICGGDSFCFVFKPPDS